MSQGLLSPEIAGAIFGVVDVLDSLDVAYVVGGSMASIVHGRVRTTLNIDLVAPLVSEHAKPFVDGLIDSFYVDE